MAKFWSRLGRWVRSKPQKADSPQASKAQSEPHLGALLGRLGDNDSLISQRALAPSTLIAGSDESPATVRKRHSQFFPGRGRKDSLLLGWPEYQHARQKRQNLDEAVPQELQQSKISSSLHDLTISAQAGTRPYSEDVADRNISSSDSLPLSIVQGHSSSQSIPTVTKRGTRKAGKPPCSYLTQNKISQGNRAFEPQAHSAHRGRDRQLSAGNITSKRQRPESTVTQLAHAIDQRRHSLPHKPDIFNLRNAVEAEQVASRTTSPRRCRSGSGSSRTSSLTRARLNAPLPPVPFVGSPTYQRLRGEDKDDRQQFEQHRETERNQTQTEDVPLTPFGGTIDTMVYERWAPAVTHETIERTTHEIREEHIHREVHNYHVRHTVQPVMDYEILPPRHFVREGDDFREIDEKDIPLGAPPSEWYASEVASQLDSLNFEDVPWDGTSGVGARRFQTTESFDGASDARSRSSRISMATFRALLSVPARSRRAVRSEGSEGSPTPKARARQARQSVPVPVVLPW